MIFSIHQAPPDHLSSSSSSSNGQKEEAASQRPAHGCSQLSSVTIGLPPWTPCVRGETWTWRGISCDDIEDVTQDCGRRGRFSCPKLFLEFPLSGSASDRTRWRTDTCQGTHKRGFNRAAGHRSPFILGRILSKVWRGLWIMGNRNMALNQFEDYHLSSGP